MLLPVIITVWLVSTTSAANIGWIWHATDFHYDFSYWSDQLSCNDVVTSPGIYGDYWCDSPWLLVKDSIEAMKRIKPDPDFILWTGDSVAHIKDEYLTVDGNVELLENITIILKDNFPNVTTYATLGNHDYLPNGQFPPNTNELYQRLAVIWADWINDTDEIENFKKGGYYASKTDTGLRLVNLNTNLYYTTDKLTADLDDPSDQLAWFDQQLSSAVADKEKVIVTAHVPPGIHTPNNVLWFYTKFNRKFMDIIEKYTDKDIITAMFFGHDHADGFKLVYKSDGSPAFPMFMAPSVTPWRFKIPGKTGDPHNPGIRLISYDRDTGIPLNIKMYYINLPDSNEVNKTDWKLEYDFSAAYNLENVRASSLHDLVGSMRVDKTLVDQYYKFKDVSVTNADKCDDDCRFSILCGLTYHFMDDFQNCRNSYLNTGSAFLSPPPLLMLLVFLCLIFIF